MTPEIRDKIIIVLYTAVSVGETDNQYQDLIF